MPKQVLKITDFKGGVNSLSDARDIQDTEFAQNWNAALDKTGIVRYTGGGKKSISTLASHSNANQETGHGLFSFATDYTFNYLDSDFNAGIERGTVSSVTNSTSFVLEATDTVSSTDDYYNTMSLFIYEGTGVGQTRQITDYAQSSRTLSHEAFATGLGTDSKYIIFKWGPDHSGDGSFGFSTSAPDIDWITDGTTANFPSGISGNDTLGTGYYLISKTGTISSRNSKPLGWIQYRGGSNSSPLTLKSGVNYTFSFDIAATRKWHGHVSNGAVADNGTSTIFDQVPWVYLYNDEVDLGLFSDGEKPVFLSTTSAAYDRLIYNYLDNGDFDSGTPSSNGWTEVESADTLTVVEDTSATCFGGDSNGTCKMNSDANFTYGDTGPAEYIKSTAMELSEDTPHHLSFVYASTDGLAYSIYDATSSVYLKDWTVLKATGADTSTPKYKFVNQEVDNTQMFGKQQFKYVNFTVPTNDSDSTRNVELRFAPIKANSEVRISGAWVKKATNDLVTMSYNGSGANPYLSNEITSWSTYSMRFRLPDGTAESDDWILRLNLGFAAHRASAVAVDGSTVSANSQTVYLDNIKLVAEETDNITLLSDNNSSNSTICIHSEVSGNWDKKSIVWQGLNSRPVFNYINGMLKICDGNFSNDNPSFLIYRYDKAFLNKYFNYGWRFQNFVLNTPPSTKITSSTVDGLSGSVFDGVSYVNTLYSGLERKNAENSPNTTGYITNWDMDRVDEFGVMLQYAAKVNSGTYASSANETKEGIQADPDDNTVHCTTRGVGDRVIGDDSFESTSGRFDGVCFWIQGNDVVNTDKGMNDTFSGAGKVAKVHLKFAHEFVTRNSDGTGNELKNSKVHDFEIKVWKIDKTNTNIRTNGTFQMTYNGGSNFDVKAQQWAADVTPDEAQSEFPVAVETINGEEQMIEHVQTLGGDDIDVKYEDVESSSITRIYNDPIDDTGDGAKLAFSSSVGEYTFSFTQDENINSTDDLMVSIKPKGFDNKLKKCFRTIGNNDAANFEGTGGSVTWEPDANHAPGAARWERIKLQNLDIEFYEAAYDSQAQTDQISIDRDCSANFNFGSPTGVDAAGWGESIFRIATSIVNIFDEESALNENKDQEIGSSSSGSGTITLGYCPTITVNISDKVLQNKFAKKTKFYMKSNNSDIWYLQFYVDHETGLLHSTTSSKKVEGVQKPEERCRMWTMERESLANFNEVDSYQAETGFSQDNAKKANNALLNCRYKASVVANNRLYVGNIKQNGVVYGDRMIKSPIGKYNLLPSTNFIDVAINDGDEITALEYFKDKLLQFKKRKVFVINTSGDYEFLEDTFDNVGVAKQCQVTKTPVGIAWANSSGCYIYDGQRITNLIDNKIGTESFQSAISNNYWVISDSNTPAIAYIKSTKKLLVALDTSSYANTSYPTMWQYDFISQGWTFCFKKEVVDSSSGTLTHSNFINNKDGDILYYIKAKNSIYKWDDSPSINSNNAVYDALTFSTKDYDFGQPAVRKKIYKVYVTYKTGSGSNSNILVKYTTNGGTSYTAFSDNSTNYAASTGLTASSGWTTAILKPPSSISNVYSFQLQFQYSGSNGIPSGFEINDFSIVYRIKPVK